MARPTLYVAITNHGFGHGTRAAAVAAAVQRRLPNLQLILTTTAPRWLLKGYIDGEFVYRQRAFDVGVVQADSLQMDKAATLEQLHHIQASSATWVAEEAEFLRNAGVQLVLADIPPLAVAIAHAAGVPCWMMSNFGWDFIYRPWGGEFTAVADWIAALFESCDRIFRLPFHEPMAAFPAVQDVGLTGGDPRYQPDWLRQQWGITAPRERTVLLTFGGLGLQQIPYAGLAAFPDWQFLTFDAQAPALPNLIRLSGPRLRPVDLMPICDRIVSKPGYSTFAEACRQRLPITTITRQDFAEAALLIEGMAAVAHHQVLEPAELFAGGWEFLKAPFTPPRQTQPIDTYGNDTIAQAIADFLGSA